MRFLIKLLSKFKKIIILFSAALVMSAFTLSNLYAEVSKEEEAYYAQSTDYLKQIAENTYNTLVAVNNIPTYLNTITELAVSWLTLDDQDDSVISQMQGSFASLGYWFTQDFTTQNTMQLQFMADIVQRPVSDFTNPVDSPAILNVLPNINDLSYATLLGLPPAPKGPITPDNYVKNAAGIRITHTIPALNWQGKKVDRDRYSSYYNTIVAVESYNGYVLSHMLAENQNGNQLTTLQNTLVNQASNSNWIAQIATEELGKVLREILMFQSQSYVLMTQLLQTQKQAVAVQAMTNSLLILNAQQSESVLVAKAQGSPFPQ